MSTTHSIDYSLWQYQQAMLSSASKPALATAAALACAAAWYAAHLRKRLQREQRLRSEERKGRTRAEAALRNLSKQRDRIPTQSLRTRQVTAIGHVETPFVKRSGTPRQGMVAPSSRGVVRLDQSTHACLSAAALDGLEDYSHIWLLFEFHANTDMHFKASKVAPPRGYGAKVGWLATRAPHRAVPVGLSLVKVDSIDAKKLEIRISALDLCHGTPIWDVKPYVPWDAPLGEVRYPTWVSRNDVLAGVRWEPSALLALQSLAPPLLCTHGFPKYATALDAKQALEEVLVQDPRNKRRRHTRGPTGAGVGTGASYKIPFAGLDVGFRVDESRTVVVEAVAVGAEDTDLLRTAVVE